MKTKAAPALLLVVLMAFGGIAQAELPEVMDNFMPLKVGNCWLYTAQYDLLDMPVPNIQIVEITHGYAWGGQEVCSVDNYCFGTIGHPLQFYSNDYSMFEVNGGEIGCWYDWSAQPDFPVTIPLLGKGDCMHGTRGYAFESGPVVVPAGRFTNTITILYENQPCADSGLVSETFAAGVGLIKRSELSITGTVDWALNAAIINGVNFGDVELFAGGLDTEQRLDPVTLDESTWGAIKTIYAN